MNETMGAIIMRLRKEKGFTQEQLANELGISYQAVSNGRQATPARISRRSRCSRSSSA